MMGADPKGALHPAERGRLVGVYPALVVDVVDPDGQGRVKVELPWVEETDGGTAAAWARLATFMAGADRGSWFIPEVNDEVLVAFVAGDPRWPIVVGALWNGSDAPPETMDAAGKNNIRSFTSRAGHKLTFDDTAGGEKVEVVTSGAVPHKIVLDVAQSTILVEHTGGSTIEIDASGTIAVTATNEVTVDAPSGMTVTAAQVTVNAAQSTFSGAVDCKSLTSLSISSPLYSPGAGNVL